MRSNRQDTLKRVIRAGVAFSVCFEYLAVMFRKCVGNVQFDLSLCLGEFSVSSVVKRSDLPFHHRDTEAAQRHGEVASLANALISINQVPVISGAD